MEFDSQCEVLPGRSPLLNEVTEKYGTVFLSLLPFCSSTNMLAPINEVALALVQFVCRPGGSH